MCFAASLCDKHAPALIGNSVSGETPRGQMWSAKNSLMKFHPEEEAHLLCEQLPLTSLALSRRDVVFSKREGGLDGTAAAATATAIHTDPACDKPALITNNGVSCNGTWNVDEVLQGNPVGGEAVVVVLEHGGRVDVRPQPLVHAELVELGPVKAGGNG